MASFYKKGDFYVVDVYQFGRIRVGKNRAAALTVFRKIELIEQSKKLGIPLDPDARKWLANAGPKIRNRLRTLGLVEAAESPTVLDLADAWRRTRSVKPSTKIHHEQVIGNLVEFLGGSTPIADVRKVDAREFRVWLQEKAGLAQATASRRFSGARSIFALAVESGWLTKNPFAGVKAGRQTNGSRSYFVTPSLAEAVLKTLPSVESRLAFALGRWAGLRIPSEIVGLRWSDVDFERRALRITSPKTAAYEGMGSRICPIFPELLPWLREARDAADEDAIFCFPELRRAKNPGQAIRSRVLKSLKRLNVDPWAKLFVNLRATRATEIEDRFGAKAESDWIGHGADVALRHYLMVSDSKWDEAVGIRGNSDSETN